MMLARATAALVGLAAIVLAAASRHWNLQAMVTLSFCLGASAVAPALVYSLFWQRFNRAGLLASMIGGAVSVLILITGTTLVSGSPQAIFPDQDFTWFPYTTTGLVSIPAGFLAGWLATRLTNSRTGIRRQEEFDDEAAEAAILVDTSAGRY